MNTCVTLEPVTVIAVTEKRNLEREGIREVPTSFFPSPVTGLLGYHFDQNLHIYFFVCPMLRLAIKKNQTPLNLLFINNCFNPLYPIPL